MKCALHLQCYFHIAQQLNRNYSDFNGELDKAQIRVRLIQAIVEECDFHIHSEDPLLTVAAGLALAVWKYTDYARMNALENLPSRLQDEIRGVVLREDDVAGERPNELHS